MPGERIQYLHLLVLLMEIVELSRWVLVVWKWWMVLGRYEVLEAEQRCKKTYLLKREENLLGANLTHALVLTDKKNRGC